MILQLPFLEKRNYLHGTTLFDAIATQVPADARISFTISRRIDTDRVEVKLRGDADAVAASESARLAWRTAESSGVVGVVPLSPSPDIARASYDEALVGAKVSDEDKAVTFAGPSPFTFVATLIPAFKRLLRSTKTPGAGQWMFTRLDLDRRPDQFLPLRLTLDAVMAGTLARAGIECCGRRIGSLYFSWVQTPAS
jgi:hypothetical protein